MKAKTYFDALGRSAQSKGQPVLRQIPKTWPQFAKMAFLNGYMTNFSIRKRGTQ